MDGPSQELRSSRQLTLAQTGRRKTRHLGLIAKVTGGAVGLLAVAATSGAAFEWIASTNDATAYPATGHLVDVGGHNMYLACSGEGSPTVVLDAGLGGSSLDWSLVQPDLAKTTRVCSFDRAGMGRSERVSSPRSPVYLAEELHDLLIKAGVPGPFVLVAHSLSGKNARLFAAAYPTEVAGMVLIDARSEYVDARLPKAEAEHFGFALRLQGAVFSIGRRLGLARAFARTLVGEVGLPDEIATQMVLQQTQPSAIDETIAEGDARSADDAALAGALLGRMPLVVIASGESLANLPNWRQAQEQMTALSTRGRLVVAEHSSHFVQGDQPSLVIDAVRDTVSDVRAKP